MAVLKYYGKYKALVMRTDDHQERGRIRVSCPEVLGEDALSAWCEPCIPYAGDYEGDFYLPKIGEAVWVEFEQGNTNKPIYLGGWFSSGSTPLEESYINAQDIRIISFGKVRLVFKGETLTAKIGADEFVFDEQSIAKLNELKNSMLSPIELISRSDYNELGEAAKDNILYLVEVEDNE